MAEKKTISVLTACCFHLKGTVFIAVFSVNMFTTDFSRADNFTDFCAPPHSGKINSKWEGKNTYENIKLIKELGNRMRYRDSQNTLVSLSNRFAPKEADNTHVVIPDPDDNVISNGKSVPFFIQKSKVDSCSTSVSTLQALEPVANDKKYACALLALDRNCLTRTEKQKNVSDPQVPQRSLVVMSYLGKAFCTGLLLDEKTMMTARHCFIRQSSGAVLEEFNSGEFSGFSIQSMDLKRKVILSKEAIVGLRTATGFDIEKDPVSIAVETIKSPSAEPLPKVLFKPAQAKQLLWIAGPFALLDQAIAMQRAYQNLGGSNPSVEWQDSIRWSNSAAAQCRVVAVSQSCIYHTCQTSEGYSGSPMIAAVYSKSSGNDDVIEVVGIHSGTPGLAQSGGWPACATSSANFDASDYSAYNVGKNGAF
ncbi:trypsin-like serine peptidase [Pseudomonas sp. 1152_12]|uniref:trypsin-like serine peptidase n=1 Tax=Pseudomonas sp. 1152_12 TaxID=2604455 RepID=UPI00406351A7